MLRHLLATSYSILALGLCLSATGCVFLGAYPLVQNVPGPVRGIRVRDSQTLQDIPNAQVSLNAEWSGITQFDSDNNGVRGEDAVTEDPEKVQHSGKFATTDTMRSGLLDREENGVFTVGLRRRFLPGIGIAMLAFADGPGYIGPLGRKHGESGYVAVVTAWAPEYKPVQLRYHAPLFAEFRCDRGEFDPRTGILAITLSEIERNKPPVR